MSKAANKRRTQRAAVAVDAYRKIEGIESDLETDFSDLLSDMWHYADAMRFDMEYLIERSRMHHKAEKV